MVTALITLCQNLLFFLKVFQLLPSRIHGLKDNGRGVSGNNDASSIDGKQEPCLHGTLTFQ